MKKLSILLACTFCTFEIFAQTSDAEAEAIINLLGVQKKEAIAKLVSVTGKDSIAFWKLYDEYQKKNVSVAKSRIQLYEKTALCYGTLTGHGADSLARQYFDNRMKQEKSLEEYYGKVRAATNSVVAFEFYQAEVYILTQIRAQIMQQIPTYGEFMIATRKK
jgi:hypothetical protein